MNVLYRKLKDKTPKWNLSNLIYAIKCKYCGKLYVGKTEQYLKKRIAQHQYAANKMQSLIDRAHLKNDFSIIWVSNSDSEDEDICRTSAIAQHMRDFNHTFDFEKC